jgi:hypothetical protein
MTGTAPWRTMVKPAVSAHIQCKVLASTWVSKGFLYARHGVGLQALPERLPLLLGHESEKRSMTKAETLRQCPAENTEGFQFSNAHKLL